MIVSKMDTKVIKLHMLKKKQFLNINGLVPEIILNS